MDSKSLSKYCCDVLLCHFLHRVVKKAKPKPMKEGEVDPKFWEMLLSAQKKDYERICREFGITDFRWMLKRLAEMKKEREEEQGKVSAQHLRLL